MPTAPLLQFLVALVIGALVGLEREQSMREDPDQGTGGIRTFMLLAQTGAIAAWLATGIGSAWVFVAMAAVVGGVIAAGYVMHARIHPSAVGITTEVAAVVVFLLGAMCVAGRAEIAVALAIATTATLAFKDPLHGLAARVGHHDLYAALQLLIATFIILPFLPDRALDPWGAINPYKLWLLVIFIAGMSLAGYVATRVFGASRGLLLTGLTGGLVSSTAVTLSFARASAAQGDDGVEDAMAAGLLTAWLVMFARVLVEVAVVNRSLLMQVAVPIGAMGLVTAGFVFALHRRQANRTRAGRPDLMLSNPFSLVAAMQFAALFAVVLLVTSLVEEYLTSKALYAVAALAGLTDVDAITLSVADQARSVIAPELATGAVVVAVLANTFVKTIMVWRLGSRSLTRRVAPAAGAIAASGLAVLLLV